MSAILGRNPFFMAYLLPGQKPKLVLFNGPRASGKDTAANRCIQALDAYHFKFSKPLKDGLRAIFELDDAGVEYLESIKTEQSSILSGKSYVNAQISLSEDWMKPVFGQQVFGFLAMRHVLRAMKQNPSQGLYVCSDSGFDYEAEPVIDIFGKENTLLVKLVREGKTFDGDSRSYIDLPGVATVTLLNDDEESYCLRVEDLVASFLAGELSPF
jgi:hypothetical protein